ncbi:hypothetical protein C1645_836748 [Glomus cerebriforme]|uniref:Uncharacterized protein n=1 Tax=Glomus cerebriforme TaxID=658196 RepID=A0A397S7Z7_9GLOM|nr:hypothetical protein C1645_836748 [Glomus cerebriforme]
MDIKSNQSSDYNSNNIKIENENKVQDISFDNIETKMSIMSLEDEDILEPFEEYKIFKEFENPEFEICTEFFNDTYKDLIILITKHKLNNRAADKIDRHLAAIPCFSDLKIFSNGLQSIAKLTANEYRSLMKVMMFIVDNLYDENNNTIDNFVNNDNFTKLYECWNEIYILSRSNKEFSESDLIKFNNAIFGWAQKFVKAFKFISPSNLKLLKLHSWAVLYMNTVCSILLG